MKTNKPNKAKEGKATEILPKKSDEAINNWKKLAVRKNFILPLFCGYINYNIKKLVIGNITSFFTKLILPSS